MAKPFNSSLKKPVNAEYQPISKELCLHFRCSKFQAHKQSCLSTFVVELERKSAKLMFFSFQQRRSILHAPRKTMADEFEGMIFPEKIHNASFIPFW